MKDQCDYLTMRGTRCKLPPSRWKVTGRESRPRKVCPSHVHSWENGGIAPDAPDRTLEYIALGYFPVVVDNEIPYQRLLAAILDIRYADYEDFEYPPNLVWKRVENAG